MSNQRVTRAQRRLDRALGRLDVVFEPKRLRIPSMLGTGTGVVHVPNRPNYDYVRLYGDDARLKPAFNIAVQSEDDIAVEVEEIRGPHGAVGYVVIGLQQKIASLGGPGLSTWWLTVRDQSGGVIVVPVTTIKVPDDHLTDNLDGSVSIDLASALAELTDVLLTSPADGDVLTYDSGAAKWVNEQPAPIGKYRQFVYEVSGGDFHFVIDVDGNPVMALQDLE